MGEQYLFQPLTRRDRITVVIYRAGIALSALILVAGAYALAGHRGSIGTGNALLFSLYISTGLSVFFIHLYVGKFKKGLVRLYIVSLFGLAGLLIIGKGDAFSALTSGPFGPLFLLPLSGCLGFVAAKEAFCFKLLEGYALAILMPAYLVMLSAGNLGPKGASIGLTAIAALFALFSVRKVFMPLHYDIGDKSAYC